MRLPFWMVYDSRAGDLPPVGATNVSMVEPAQYRQNGLWHTADTLAGLAEAIGVPAVELQATVERFNTLAAAGVDEDFNRGAEAYDRTFTDGGSPLVPIDTRPTTRPRSACRIWGPKADCAPTRAPGS